MNHKSQKSHYPRGFALIITLSLMILLTIIAVGLLSLSSISLRSTRQGDALATARGNARLALMLAIAELQKNTGSDQRVTAVADIAGDANGLPLAAGATPANNLSVNGDPKGLSAVQPGTRYWTGVWSNNNTTNPDTEIYTKTPSVKFQQWLVSGNETGSISYTPASPSCGVSNTGKVSDNKTAVVLAGTNSVGAPGTHYTRFVSVPVVGINSTVSGASKLVGRYAWWVGDEGVKSKINMKESYTKDALATYPLLTAQRRGWESASGFGKYPVPGSDTTLPNAITLSEAALLDNSFSTPVGGTPLQLAFHSATADSYGVLADTLQGGLKLDLTACLNKMTPVTSSFKNTFDPAKNIIPEVGSSPSARTGPAAGPKWQQLKDFQTFAATAASTGVLNTGTITGAAGAVAPQGSGRSAANNSTNLPVAGLAPGSPVIAPVIVDIRFVMGAQWEVPDSTKPTVYGFRPCAKLSLVLANPYPFQLNFKNLDLEVLDETPSGNGPSRIYVSVPNGDTTGPAGGQNYPLLDRNQGNSLFQKTLFRISAASLAPGASRAYTVGAFTDIANSRTVPMVEMTATADPLNMGICVRGLLSPNRYTFTSTSNVSLDIRESHTTSTPSVELRLAGSLAGNNVLRRIERFEFDNGAFVATQRHFGDHDASGSPPLNNVANWTKPFGMQLFGYQMSIPGADYYGSYLPTVAGNSRGARGATRRLYADFNIQALRFGKPIACYSPAPYFMMQRDSYADFNTVASVGTSFANMPAPRWARSATSGSATGVFFGFPSSFVSLAQFQHADLTANDFFLSVSQEPGNAAGNSYAPPFVTRDVTTQARTDYYFPGMTITAPIPVVGTPVNYYDISHLLNTALWDTYFLSTMQGTGVTLNPSIQKIDPKDISTDLQDPVKASSRLLVNGALNVNATEKDAWKALLSSAKFLKHPKDDASADTANAMFPRSLDMISPSKVPATGTDADSFSGFRRLTPDQIDALAAELARQVRLRGPFVSLSQFVNRALVTLASDTNGLGRSGALQSAIDQSAKININLPSAVNPSVTCSFGGPTMNMAQEPVVVPVNGTRNEADLTGTNPGLANPDDKLVWPSTSRDLNMGTAGSIFADRDPAKGDILSATYAKELGYRSTGIPGWLTQADVLQVIGPSLTARSDTFRIRAYGEALDANGNTTATAYCEAVLQRTPNYVDSTDAPQTTAVNLTSTANKQYGRKYSIISFRWLSSNEI